MGRDKMIQVENTLVHEEIFTQKFICDLSKCKGSCCIEGNAGAPLLESELELLEATYPIVAQYMSSKGIATVEQEGIYVKDIDGDLTTPCVDTDKECAYVIIEKGIAKCAIEKAYEEGKIKWQKPISCHLYPIRVTAYPEFDALYYNQWSICKEACSFGKEKNVLVYQFLKAPLIRNYGEKWYQSLELVARQLSKVV